MKIILKILIFNIIIFNYQNLFSQSYVIKGNVSGITNSEHKIMTEKLAFANVFWEGSGTATTTDKNGKFSIVYSGSGSLKLVASYVGYQSDTLLVKPGVHNVDFILVSNATLQTVEIKDKVDNYISKLKPIKTEVISSEGLQKLACCNLSESFEQTATVDVGYTDAVSGAKRIQMLGLSGVYSQMMMENIPMVRGLSSSYGLTYIPGSWMHSIQVSKGTSSVINGYESITGQINVEYKKPETNKEPFFFNLFGNSDGRFEANMNSTIKINDKWSTMILAHGAYNGFMIDLNKDGFLDVPKSWTANFLNRWEYEMEGKGHIQFGIGYLQDDKQGGQKQYYKSDAAERPDYYRTQIDSKQYSAFLKAGLFFGENGYKSLGIVSSFTRTELKSLYGIKNYNGDQNSAYLNVIYQSIFGNTNHKFSTGGGITYDGFSQSLEDSAFASDEMVPGVFFQYTYSFPEKLNVIAGMRADYHSLHGFFFTPRLHIKFDVTESFIIRASAGRGYRSPQIIAENTGILASSRSIIIEEKLQYEEAWNFGINFTKDFMIGEDRNLSFGMDYYYTRFVNQIVLDLDRSPQKAVFYNLKGLSYSNSVQADFSIQPLKRFDITLAGRYNDVRKNFDGKTLEAPYVSKFKGLLTLSYATLFEKWKFDATLQYNGRARLPGTDSNPELYRRPGYSKGYFMLHAQITKRFKQIDIYAGAENITNYMQHHPIIAADDPFGNYFDASMIWGPVMGVSVYAGLRLTIK